MKLYPNWDVIGSFSGFWNEEKAKAISQIWLAENIAPDAFKAMIERYDFTGKQPLQGAVVEALTVKAKYLNERQLLNISSLT